MLDVNNGLRNNDVMIIIVMQNNDADDGDYNHDVIHDNAGSNLPR